MYTAEPLALAAFLLRPKFLLKSWKGINLQVLIKIRQSWA